MSSSSSSTPLPIMTTATKQQPQQQQQQLSRLPTRTTAISSRTSTTSSIVPSIIAGYASGICAVVVGHPMDSAKVWLQTNTNMQHVLTSGATSSTSSNSSRMMSTMISSPSVAAAAKNMSTLATPLLASTTSSTSTTATTPKTVIRPQYNSWRTVRALYAGVTGPLLTVGVVQSLNFAIYETARRELFQWQQYCNSNNNMNNNNMNTTTTPLASFDRNTDSLINVALAGATSGVFLSVVTAPILLVKTTSQIQGIGFRQSLLQVLLGKTSSQPRTPTSTTTTTTTTKSITILPSWYRVGFGIHSFIEILSRSVYYATYEGCKRYLRSHRSDDEYGAAATSSSSDGNTLPERMISAAAAGISCWAVIFPLDSIRSRIYAQLAANVTTSGSSSSRPLVAWDMAKTMYQQGSHHPHPHGGNESSTTTPMYRRGLQGLRPFFRGFGVTVLRAGPVAAAALPVYDYVLEQVSTRYQY